MTHIYLQTWLMLGLQVIDQTWQRLDVAGQVSRDFIYYGVIL